MYYIMLTNQGYHIGTAKCTTTVLMALVAALT
jgi:hypothetical protein